MSRHAQASSLRRRTRLRDKDFTRDWITRQVGLMERRRVTLLAFGRLTGKAPPIPREKARRTVLNRGGLVLCQSPSSLVACWGYPHAREDDPRLALQAAFDLLALYKPDPPIASTLDSGLVSVPSIASEFPDELNALVLRMEHMLQSVGRPGAVIASDAVRVMVDRYYAFEPIYANASPPNTWRVAGALPPPEEHAKDSGNELVGRIEERRAIDHAWDCIMRGRAACISISGEAGIGKSQLLRYLEQRAKTASTCWISFTCLPETRRVPLHPIRQALRELYASHELERPIAPVDHSDRQLIERLLDVPSSPDAGDTDQQAPGQARIFDLLLDWVAARARRQPIALAFEDLHWADRHTLDFIHHVGARLYHLGPVCLAWTSRRPEPRGFKTEAFQARLELAPLSADDIHRMLESAYNGQALTPTLKHRIALRSEGIPLFAQELARIFATSRCTRNELELLLEPGPLNLVLSARLDSLGSLKPLAQAASVLGPRIDAAVLAPMLQMDRSRLLFDLDSLAEHGILEPEFGPEGAWYRFSHVLLRDAAYTSVIASRLGELHGRAAEVLANDPKVATEAPEIIAGHYEAAGDCRGAFVWWLKAGVRAAELSSQRIAISHLNRALRARHRDPSAGSLQEEVEVLRLLGVQLATAKGNGSPEAIKVLERCLELSRQLPGGADFDALWTLHSCYLVRGEMNQALQIGEKLTAIADETGAEERRLRAHRMQGLAKLLSGQLEASFAHYRLVLELYNERRHAALRFRHGSDQGALAYAHLAWGEAIAGRMESSSAHAEAALKLSCRLRHPHTSAHVLCVLAARAQTLGEQQSASILAFAGKTLGNWHEFPYWSAWADIILGWTQADRAGLAPIEQAIRAYRRTGAVQALPYALLLLAQAALTCNRPRIAIRAASEGWDVAKRQGLMLYAAELLRIRALAEMQLGSETFHLHQLISQAKRIAALQGADTFFQRAAGFRLHCHTTGPGTGIGHATYSQVSESPKKTGENAQVCSFLSLVGNFTRQTASST